MSDIIHDSERCLQNATVSALSPSPQLASVTLTAIALAMLRPFLYGCTFIGSDLSHRSRIFSFVNPFKKFENVYKSANADVYIYCKMGSGRTMGNFFIRDIEVFGLLLSLNC